MVAPGPFVPSPAPSDAIVLFDGKDLSAWAEVKDGTLTNDSFSVKQTGEIHTRQEFGDCQLHLEWATPAQPDGNAMNWGNSGVFLLGLYEVQIIQTDIYADGISGAIYGQTPPLARAMRPAGEWQSYDIVFTAPRVDADGKLAAPACFTVFLNDVLVQNHTAALGPTRHRVLGHLRQPGHARSGHAPVSRLRGPLPKHLDSSTLAQIHRVNIHGQGHVVRQRQRGGDLREQLAQAAHRAGPQHDVVAIIILRPQQRRRRRAGDDQI